MGDLAPPEKKKRRQNVACDACRLRRVKCDMLNLLTADADPSRPTPPLHVLVRERPDIGCSNCVGKGIRCTTIQIVNPSKPNKGGRRIEEAKRKYGSDGAEIIAAEGYTSSTRSPTGSSPAASSAGNGLAPPLAMGGYPYASSSSRSTPTPTPNYAPSPLPQQHTGNAYHTAPPPSFQAPTMDGAPMLSSLAGIDPFVANPMMYFDNTGMHMAASAPPPPLAPPGLPLTSTASTSTSTTHPGWTIPSFSFDPSIGDLHLSSDGFETAWDALPPGTLTPAGSDSLNTSAVPRPDDPATSTPVGPTSQPLPSLDLDYTFDPLSDAFVPRSHSSSAASSSLLSSSPNVTPSSALSTAASHRSPKRSRDQEDEDVIELRRGGPDPYSLWAAPENTLRWGHPEVVGERLADRALGHELSRHLIKVYFQAVHLSLPAISPEAFYMEWQRGTGERADRLPPAQEALSAVMEASDAPVILGLSMAEADKSPKVITENGQFRVSGERDRVQWGKARLKACRALLDRARQLIDMHGLLRRPSMTGLQAVALFTQLQHMSDNLDNNDIVEMELENEMMQASVIQGFKQLGLRWSADALQTDSLRSPLQNEDISNMGKLPIPMKETTDNYAQMRIKQRRLFWTTAVADAFWAAASAAEPKIPDSEFQYSGEWLLDLEETLGPSPFKTLSFYLKIWHKCARIGRKIARQLAIPCRRPGTVDVQQFADTVRKTWVEVRDLYKHLSSRSDELLRECGDEILGFSPIHSLSSIRNSFTFLLLITHQLIDDQLKFRKSLSQGFIHHESASPQATQAEANIQLLEKLHFQSVDTTLTVARATVPLLKSLQPTGMMQGACMMLRMVLSMSQFLAEIPTNEQGYPMTSPGGNGWTWETKQRDIEVCVETLHQMGWAWADVEATLDRVNSSMERLHPTLLEMADFAAKEKPEGYDGMAAQKQRDAESDDKAVQAALHMWPPMSVPQVVEAWSREAIAAGQSTTEPLPKPEGAHNYPMIDSYAIQSDKSSSATLQRPTGSGSPYAGGGSLLSIPSTDRANTNNTNSTDSTSSSNNAPPARRLVMTPAMVWALQEPPVDAAAREARERRAMEEVEANEAMSAARARLAPRPRVLSATTATTTTPAAPTMSDLGISDLESFLASLISGGKQQL